MAQMTDKPHQLALQSYTINSIHRQVIQKIPSNKEESGGISGKGIKRGIPLPGIEQYEFWRTAEYAV